ncbi:hypothetical protein ACL02S_17330 [Nocardia sp. 004]|uniref:hypothetical protein n=1 Tax=Nocardia sp. 004 TaxID=3385978 RepID=UPI0039A1E54E
MVFAENTSDPEAVQQLGFTPAEISVDIRKLLRSNAPQKHLMRGSTIEFSQELTRLEVQSGADIDDALIRACEDADIVVTGPLTSLRALWIVERSGQPLTGCLPYPIEHSRQFPSPHIVDRPIPQGIPSTSHPRRIRAVLPPHQSGKHPAHRMATRLTGLGPQWSHTTA